MKLLCLHVSEHRDENLVRAIWNRIFEDGILSILFLSSAYTNPGVAAMEAGVDPQITADRIIAKAVPLGQRFYPSESAFPLRKCLPRNF
jgi:nuclear pore complex protein Nup155